MDAINAQMRKILLLSIDVCDKKCIPINEKDTLTSFEKGCLSKCLQKNVTLQFNLSHKLGQAFVESKKDKYDQDF